MCGSHILVATAAEAQDVVARLAAGEEFADVLRRSPLDGSADRAATWAVSSRRVYVPEFAAAARSRGRGADRPGVESSSASM